MGLEAVVVGGVADDPFALGQRRQAGDLGFVLGQDGFLDEDVLPVLHEVGEELDLGLVGGAHQGRVVGVEGYVADVPDGGVAHRIDGGGDVRTGHGGPFVALHAHSDDDDFHGPAHAKLICFSTARALSRTRSGVTGTLPSYSHSTAAAKEPRMEATTALPVAAMASVA